MKVFVKNQNNEPLMPTTPRKARFLLKSGKAEVVQRNPFTIRLDYPTGSNTQDITLGIDSGYSNIGFSAITTNEELISGEVKLLQGMKERNEQRKMYRRNRRSRLWHRRPKHNVNTNKEGWFAPSIQHKLDSHIRFIGKLHEILPITKIIVEIGNFDIQKIKNSEIKGKDYQNGEMKGFDNVRSYILHRDGYKCQNPDCKNKDKEQILHVHHIQYRSNGGSNLPSNLITLCNRCHTPENHKGFLLTWKPIVRGFKDASFMNIIKWKILEELNEKYDVVKHTYGYVTKNKRYELNLEKSHANDAFCIANGDNQVKNIPYIIQQVRRNNRSLSRFYDAKYIDSRDGNKKSGSELNCGRTCRNKNLNSENLRKYRLEKISKGKFPTRIQRHSYQPNDIIEFNNEKYYIKGSRGYGKYVVLKGNKKSLNIKYIKLINYGKGFCWIDNKINLRTNVA